VTFVIEAAPVVTIPVHGGGLFPVRRVFCVGKNYAPAPVNAAGREAPFFFMKATDSIVSDDRPVVYPRATGDFHYEMEMVVAIGAFCEDLASGDGAAAIWGYAAGLDMTRRDLQNAARESGRPWELGKSFEDAAPIGPLRPAQLGRPGAAAEITLSVNGAVRQSSTLGNMIWSAAEQVEILSRFVQLRPGDLLFTGTPPGVGAVVAGDTLIGSVQGVGEVHATIVARSSS
jgi:fumarylpyruvate hydrolase